MTARQDTPVDGSWAPPAWWANGMVSLAAAVLPHAEQRRRYRREFLAELYGLPRARHARHAGQVLGRAWALRSALRDRELPIGEDGDVIGFWGRLGCRLRLHNWRWYSTEDGQRYQSCVRCRTDRSGDFGEAPWPFGGA